MPLWCVGHLDSLHMVNMACIEMCSTVDVILLYCFKGAIADRSGLYSPIELDDVTEWNMLHCHGTEATITECLITSTERCPSNEVASAICQSKFIFCECDSSESNTVYSHALKVHLLSMATVAMAR